MLGGPVATNYIRARETKKGKRYDVLYRRGGRYHPLEHAGTFKTKRDAETRRQLIAGWLAAGINPKVMLKQLSARAITFGDAHREWKESRRSISDGTRDAIGYREKVLLDRFGSVPVDEILYTDVIAWVRELEKSYAPGTVRGYIGDLRLALDFTGLPNPARDRRVELPPVRRKEPDPPDAPETLAMLAMLKGSAVAVAVTMEHLGSRVTETLRLTADDVDACGCVVRFRRETTKGGYGGRRVECADWFAELIRGWLPFRYSDRRVMGMMMKRASNGVIHPHALRHRRASLWYQQGIGPVDLARRLGHAKPSMSLDVYSSVKPLKEIAAHELVALLR